jgi:(p)ppGpp synthase/HD superfamily hydrolase
VILSERFDQALAFAVRVHGNQMRKGTDIPYLSHLLMVAAIALDYGATEDEAIAALLHDVIEDGGVEHAAAISEQFGTAVLDIVYGCSDTDEIPKPPAAERKARYIEGLRRELNRSVLFVSACDKLANSRSILKDYRLVGDDVWTRFKLGRQGTLKYYTDLVHVYAERGTSPVVDEFARVVGELTALTGDWRQGASW